MKRSISADLIKSLSIFGVVYIHGSFLLGGNLDIQKYSTSLFRFCVPCFIIIWAYFFEKGYQKTEYNKRIKYIWKKFFHLFTVFFIWSLFYFFKLAEWDTINIEKIITTHFSGYGWSGQYFFIILFQLLLVFPLLRYCYNNKFIKYSLLILILIVYVYWGYFHHTLPTLISKIGYRPFFFWIPYVFVGISLRRNEIKRIRLANLWFVFLIPIEFYILRHYGFDAVDYITPVILFSSIIFCIALIQNDLEIKSDKTVNFITYIGKNTLTIFVANPIVILLLSEIIPKNIFPSLMIFKIFLPFISCFLVMSICLLISFLITKIKLNGILN